MIKIYDDAIRHKWDRYVLESASGSFFHLTGWKRVVEKSFGHKAFYFYAEKNGHLDGILPLFYTKGFLGGGSLVSVPLGVYGGILADDQEVRSALLGRAVEKAKELGVKYLELRNTEATEFELPTKNLYVTFQQRIGRDHEQNLAMIPRKQRRMIRQGMKHGLISQIGGNHLQSFYEIYAQSMKTHGTPVIPYQFFRNLQEEFGEQCKILSVWHNGMMVAGVLTFFFKDWVMPYYSGALSSSRSLAVSDFMYWELIRYGCEQGFNIFDFGRSKQGTGSFEFKRHWGFEPKPLPYQYYLPDGASIPNMSPANPKFKHLITLWKKLPLPVANFLGPRIIQYIP